MNVKRFVFAAAVLGAVALTAQAATVNSLITYVPGGGDLNVFASDENRETLIDRDGNGFIDQGDSLRGIITFDQLVVNGGVQNAMVHSSGNSELTGVFQLLVAAKVSTGNPLNPFNFVFAPDPAFDTAGNGTMIRLYEDFVGGTTFDLDDNGTPLPKTQAAAEATVTDGSFYWSLGIANPGNAWVGGGFDDPSLAVNPSFRFGTSAFALDRTAETFGLGGLGAIHALLPQTDQLGNTGEFIGTSNIGGPTTGSPWPLSSDSQAEFVVVPVPAAVYPGLAMLGGVIYALRRRSA
jgi:hypothetical protein